MKVSHRIISHVIYRKFSKEKLVLNIITSGQYSWRNYLFPALAKKKKKNIEGQNDECSNPNAASMLLKYENLNQFSFYVGLTRCYIMNTCTKSCKQLWHALWWFLYF